MTHNARFLFALLLAGLLVLAGCGGDDDSGGEGSGGGASDGTDSDGGTVATVSFTTSDGASFTLDVVSCSNPSESTVQITARSETADLDVDATDGAGTLAFTSAEGDRKGTVTSAQVGDTGNVSIAGSVTPADGSDESETFDISGQCG